MSSVAYEKATVWWKKLEQEVLNKIKTIYVKESRASDANAGTAAFGDPKIGATVKGKDFTWRSIMSTECANDLWTVLAVLGYTSKLDDLTVDSVFALSVLLITSKLFKIY